MKTLLSLWMVLGLTACGNDIKIPEKITVETVLTDNRGSTSAAGNPDANPDQLELCKNSQVRGNWRNFADFGYAEFYMRFKANCELVMPRCADTYTYALSEETDGVGKVTFEVKNAPLDKECYPVGEHHCTYSITEEARMQWICDEETAAKTFKLKYE